MTKEKIIINDRIIKTEKIEWRKMVRFQPKNLKKLTDEQRKKLKTSLRKNKFSAPFYVWHNKGEIYVIDGHYRMMVMLEMEKQENDIEIPDKLTANFIEIKNKNEAKKLVLVYNSHYPTIISSSLISFMSEMSKFDINSEINIPHIELNIPDNIINTEKKLLDENQYIIIISCESKKDMNKKYKFLKEKNYDCRKV